MVIAHFYSSSLASCCIISAFFPSFSQPNVSVENTLYASSACKRDCILGNCNFKSL